MGKETNFKMIAHICYFTNKLTFQNFLFDKNIGLLEKTSEIFWSSMKATKQNNRLFLVQMSYVLRAIADAENGVYTTQNISAVLCNSNQDIYYVLGIFMKFNLVWLQLQYVYLS